MNYANFFTEWVNRRNIVYGHVRKDINTTKSPFRRADFINIDSFTRNKEEFLKQRDSTKTGDVDDQLEHASKHYGISVINDWGRTFQKFPRDGSLLYRGHKALDPFVNTTSDAKMDSSKGVYWANNPQYVYNVYSRNNNGSQSKQVGQSGRSNLQNAVNNVLSDRILGYLTIGTPKNPDNIVWYRNFGIEDGQPPLKDRSQLASLYDGEAAANKNDLNKIRTYLVLGDGDTMIPIYILQKNYPEIYNVMVNG